MFAIFFQISTYNHATVMMLMADTPILMATWLTPIQLTIKKLVSRTYWGKMGKLRVIWAVQKLWMNFDKTPPPIIL